MVGEVVAEHGGPDCVILAERQAVLASRLDSLESKVTVMQTSSTELLVELKVLQTRVSLYAALVAAGVSLIVKFLV